MACTFAYLANRRVSAQSYPDYCFCISSGIGDWMDGTAGMVYMNMPFTIGAACMACYLGFSVSRDAIKIIDPAPRALVLEVLKYNPDGTVTQKLSGNITAQWSARVHRQNGALTTVLCSGPLQTETGVYVGNESTWAMNDWVGDDCPELQAGDEARAAWEYRNDAGILVTVIGRFVVPAEEME